MSTLQPRLNLKVSQKQILTPGLVQMVSVLALNKLELKDMITAEMVENPVLEEYLDAVPSIDDVAAREEQRERDSAAPPEDQPATPQERDPFEEIDFGSFFRDYLDPGYRSGAEMESVEKPSFENFLSRPTTLTDHLMWQLGAVHHDGRRARCRRAGDRESDQDGYLLATDEELLAQAAWDGKPRIPLTREEQAAAEAEEAEAGEGRTTATESCTPPRETVRAPGPPCCASRRRLARRCSAAMPCTRRLILVRQMDPVGVGSRELRECLLAQLKDLAQQHDDRGGDPAMPDLLRDCHEMVDTHLPQLQNKQLREIARAMGISLERRRCTAWPSFARSTRKPGLRYNKPETRLIEPDVAFVKQGDEYLVVMNDDDMPQLRLNPTYRKLLSRDAAEKDVRNYVKERYKSAIQLIKNIEQRKQTILKVCYAIIGRQQEFLDRGIDQLKPMMIKEVAEEIGVHPSTVSRAVANKYAHTPQGVFELRYFFSESVQRAGGRRHVAADPQAPGQETDRGRGPGASAIPTSRSPASCSRRESRSLAVPLPSTAKT